MKKTFITLCLISVSSLAYSQVGINTPNPQGALHVDGAKDNPDTGAPTATQQANDFTVTSTGKVGIGNINPSSNLHIVNNGTATGIGGGEATNTGLLIENPTTNNSILSILRTTGVTGVKQAVMGINPNFNGNNGTFIISRVPGGSDFAMDLTTGNIGVATNIPTNTLDVAGSTRVRTLDVAAGATIITPVYSNTDGVLNKAVNNTYGTVLNNTITNVASGATVDLMTNIPLEGSYKAIVMTGNSCGRRVIAEYYVTNIATNNAFSIKGIDGLLNTDTTSKGPTFTEVNRNTTTVVWNGTVPTCGGSPTPFNYTLTMPVAGTISITNNGTSTLNYTIILTRLI
ncbi:hypothetical protein [Chryseobacterium limigenitum]|uniref:Uncharacterized protein n=1 Tax=Chryseobacterium limigenitum TaxID=1612149 RepID=A0A1K2ID35_9FLAO|nr:hypothetical protein [Chryseobacterium limigenitum]SFZ90303.1 hypothetical protein SAMN05216324_101300 [Chryseobacterium limigenitum]